MLEATITKNDKQAKWLIGIFSFVVFSAVVNPWQGEATYRYWF